MYSLDFLLPLWLLLWGLLLLSSHPVTPLPILSLRISSALTVPPVPTVQITPVCFAISDFIPQLHPKIFKCLSNISTHVYVLKVVFMIFFPPEILLLLNHLLIKRPSTLLVAQLRTLLTAFPNPIHTTCSQIWTILLLSLLTSALSSIPVVILLRSGPLHRVK